MSKTVIALCALRAGCPPVTPRPSRGCSCPAYARLRRCRLSVGPILSRKTWSARLDRGSAGSGKRIFNPRRRDLRVRRLDQSARPARHPGFKCHGLALRSPEPLRQLRRTRRRLCPPLAGDFDQGVRGLGSAIDRRPGDIGMPRALSRERERASPKSTGRRPWAGPPPTM